MHDIYLLDPADNQVIAKHPRSFARKRDIINPDHQNALDHLTKRSRQNHAITDFLKLGGDAHAYLLGLKDKQPNYRRHITQINALTDIYGTDSLRLALADCHAHHAYSAAYIHSHLSAQQRSADTAPGPLHITRNADLLRLELPEPDLDSYDPPQEDKQEPTA